MPDADEIRKLLNKFFSIEESGYGVEQLDGAVAAILSYCQEREREARREELIIAFSEFSKDVPFDERLAYYDNRLEQLSKQEKEKK